MLLLQYFNTYDEPFLSFNVSIADLIISMMLVLNSDVGTAFWGLIFLLPSQVIRTFVS